MRCLAIRTDVSSHRIWGLVEASAIQLTGSAATFLVQLLLARLGGPEVQGGFSLVKAEVDFLMATLVVGLPQAVFYFVQKGDLPIATSVKLAARVGMLATILALLWGVVSVLRGQQNLATAAAIAAAAGSSVHYSILRGALLSVRSSRAFAIFSAAPAVVILLLVGALLATNSQLMKSQFLVALLFLGAFSACGAWGLLQLKQREMSSSRTVSFFGLARFGVASWVPTVCQSGVVFIALGWISERSGEAAGATAAALALASIAVTPLNLMSPLLFKEWTSLTPESRRHQFIWAVGIVLVFTIVFSSIVYGFSSEIVRLVFGAEYVPFAAFFALLSLLVAPQSMAKLWTVLCSAAGKPWLSSIVDAAKLLLFVLGLVMFALEPRDAILTLVCSEYAAIALGLIVLAGFRFGSSGRDR